MQMLCISVLGGFRAQFGGRTIEGLGCLKAQELLSYLIVQRGRSHTREALATLLWSDAPPEHSRKYLRQALWQVRTALAGCTCARALQVEGDAIRLDLPSTSIVDVVAFETKAESLRPRSEALDDAGVVALEQAASCYTGALLEGWYHDWCLCERERLQNLYLAVLDKLIGWCEARGHCDAGVKYAERMLRIDRAHELTYQRLMRLYLMNGDRAGAIRQYERCASALRTELGVKPSARTERLLAQVRGDGQTAGADAPPRRSRDLLGALIDLRGALADLQQRLDRQIEAFDGGHLTPP